MDRLIGSGPLAQLVERHVYTVDVVGSIPAGPTTFSGACRIPPHRTGNDPCRICEDRAVTETPLWLRPTSTGWRVAVDEGRTLMDVLDPAGAVHARVPVKPTETFTGPFADRMNSTTNKAFEDHGPQMTFARRPVPFELTSTGGSGTLTPGAVDGRRSTKSLVIELRGRHYVLRHTSSSKADALRDGALIVTFAKGRQNGVHQYLRTDLVALDSTDEIALTIFEKLGRPGRAGAISDFFTALSNLP